MADTVEDRRALDDLFSATYEELKRLAASVKGSFSRLTVSPTALVDEAWMKLRGSPKMAGLPRLEFRRVAARAMRQVLVDAARRVDAGKRDVELVTLDPSTGHAALDARQVLEIDHELTKLAENDPKSAQLVEYRFFAGMTDEEIAELMDCSTSTVERAWRLARARLKKALGEN